jgi:hypothetical protein
MVRLCAAVSAYATGAVATKRVANAAAAICGVVTEFLLSSDDVEQIKQDDNRDWNPEQPKQNASTHSNLLPDDKNLFLAGDLANGVLGMANRTLNPALGLIGLAFGFGAGIAQGFSGLFLDFAGDLLHASCNTILIHCQSLCMI